MVRRGRVQIRGAAAFAVLAIATAGLTACASGVAGSTGPSDGPARGRPATTSVVLASTPSDLLLPDEARPGTAADLTDWETDRSPTRPWLLDPCRPTAYPTDIQRVDFRTVSRSGPETFDARQLAAYPTAKVAAEAIAGFRRVLAACRTGGDAANGTLWQYVVDDRGGLGDEGFVAASTTGGPTFAPAGERLAVTRVGSMVFLAYSRGEYGTAEVDDGARKAERIAREFLAPR